MSADEFRANIIRTRAARKKRPRRLGYHASHTKPVLPKGQVVLHQAMPGVNARKLQRLQQSMNEAEEHLARRMRELNKKF